MNTYKESQGIMNINEFYNQALQATNELCTRGFVIHAYPPSINCTVEQVTYERADITVGRVHSQSAPSVSLVMVRGSDNSTRTVLYGLCAGVFEPSGACDDSFDEWAIVAWLNTIQTL